MGTKRCRRWREGQEDAGSVGLQRRGDAAAKKDFGVSARRW